jgi:hypothetical protein
MVVNSSKGFAKPLLTAANHLSCFQINKIRDIFELFCINSDPNLSPAFVFSESEDESILKLQEIITILRKEIRNAPLKRVRTCIFVIFLSAIVFVECDKRRNAQ